MPKLTSTLLVMLQIAQSGLPHWPAYDDELRAVMNLDAEPVVATDPKGTVRQLLNGN